jgi:hypothetical protein
VIHISLQPVSFNHQSAVSKEASCARTNAENVILNLKEKMEMLNNLKRDNISGKLGSARIFLIQLAHPFSMCQIMGCLLH